MCMKVKLQSAMKEYTKAHNSFYDNLTDIYKKETEMYEEIIKKFKKNE